MATVGFRQTAVQAPTTGWWAQRFELSRGLSGANLQSMEGLRGFAVLLVFCVHYATLVQPWLSAGGDIGVIFDVAHSIGHAGVDLFFVLSGYLIYGHLITSKPAFGRYLARRLQRIYPVFLVMLVVYLLIYLVRPSDSKLPAGAAAASLYVLENILLLPGIFPIRPIIVVAWSLSYEMFYYLIMPMMIALLALHRRKPEWRLNCFAVMTVVALAGFALTGGPVRLVMFLAGVVLFEALPRWRSPSAALAVAALLLCLAAMRWPMPGPAGQALRVAVLYAGFFAVCLHCFGQPKQWVARAFCWTPLRWLGNMSYSYYLIHGLCLRAFFLMLEKLLPAQPADAVAVGLLLPALALTLLVSALLFLGVERPFSLHTTQPAAVSNAALLR